MKSDTRVPKEQKRQAFLEEERTIFDELQSYKVAKLQHAICMMRVARCTLKDMIIRNGVGKISKVH